MLRLPTVKIPDFISLVCGQEEESIDFLVESVSNNQYILNLIYDSYNTELTKKNIRELFNRSGYAQSILLISNIYVQRSLLRSYPGNIMPEISKKMTRFYEQSMAFTENTHRSILLTTFLGLAEGEMRAVYKNNKIEFLKFKPVAITILSAMKSKVEHIDLLYILILLLDNMESLENIQKFMVKGKTFINLFKTLEENKQKSLILNLLTYGQAINESHFFTKPIEVA